jgi:hypothetical protein
LTIPFSSPARRLSPLLVLAVAGCTAAAVPPATAVSPVAAPTAPQVSAEDLRLRVGILADDSLRGRRTGAPGIRAASDYLVREARRLGLRPAGENGTYLARVPLTQRVTTTDLTAQTPRGQVPLTRSDALLVSGFADLPGKPRGTGEAPIVYGGYMVDPGVTAQQELKPAQVNGAALLIRFGPAPGVNAESARPRLPIPALIAPGSLAAAVLLVAEGPLEPFWEYVQGSHGMIQVAGKETNEAGGGPPVFLVSPATAERLLGAPLAGARTPRTGLGTFRYRIQERTESLEAWNVVAALPGSDRRRAGEYVSIGAHYDHVGVGEPVNGDSIYNGADDDASGTSAVLEIAERYAALPAAQRPARSLLFVWHTAEEEGLLGSQYFTDNPTVPRDSIVAQLNIDMIGRNHPDSIFLVGSRRLSTALGDLVEQVNRGQQRPLALDYTFDAPGHPEQIYCRSDHYNYARHGIPVTFFTTGLHPDYHKPSDEPETVDYTKLARVTQFIGEVAAAVANAPAKPAVDKPVPPLGTPCSQ